MAPVAGHYFLEYLLDWLRSFNIKDLILCVGHKSDQVQNWLGNGSKWGVHVRYSVEDELLGTGGALKLAAFWGIMFSRKRRFVLKSRPSRDAPISPEA